MGQNGVLITEDIMRNFYYIENETLVLKNGLMKIKGVKDAKWAKEDGNGLSLPFVKVKAEILPKTEEE